MTTYQILESMVNDGETTWQEVLQTIKEIKEPQPIPEAQRNHFLELKDKNLPHPNTACRRIDLFLSLSKRARQMVEIVLKEDDPNQLQNKRVLYKKMRKEGWIKPTILRTIEELKAYADELACY